MKEIRAFEAKNKFGQLLDWVEAGDEVVITRRGKIVAMRRSWIYGNCRSSSTRKATSRSGRQSSFCRTDTGSRSEMPAIWSCPKGAIFRSRRSTRTLAHGRANARLGASRELIYAAFFVASEARARRILRVPSSRASSVSNSRTKTIFMSGRTLAKLPCSAT